MSATTGYSADPPAREDVEQWQGAAVLEFGTDFCGFCLGAQPIIRAGLATDGALKHVKVEDGTGRRLGRSFQVKLWPTLIFLRDGKEVARVVRPSRVDQVTAALAQTR